MNWTNAKNESITEGSYLGLMENGYIKMIYFNGNQWLDMWKTTLEGNVKSYMNIPR